MPVSLNIYKKKLSSHFFCLLTILMLGIISSAHAVNKFYKWKDENGNIYYSDQVPPEEASTKRETLNEQGITTEVTDAKTAEEMIAELALIEQQKKEEQQKKIQQQEDRYFLKIYNTESELINAKNQKLADNQAMTESIQLTLTLQHNQLRELVKLAANDERSGRYAAAKTVEYINELKHQIIANRQYIDIKKQERISIEDSFQKEMQRFRNITSDNNS